MKTPQEILKKVSQRLSRDTFFVPIVGYELEFYVLGEYDDEVISFLERMSGYAFEKERGDGQFEIKIPHSLDVVALANHVDEVRNSLLEAARVQGVDVSFDAMPQEGQPGNGMHVHVNLYHPEDHTYPFHKNEDGEESEWMLYAIAGLLHHMTDSMHYFAPDEEAMRRYAFGSEVPQTISWGGNNRTVALRLPTTTTEPNRRRIEHRVPCASANPHFVVACILEAIRDGILCRKKPPIEKIYGDASLEQYGMVALFKSETQISL